MIQVTKSEDSLKNSKLIKMRIIINLEAHPYVRMTQKGKYVDKDAQSYLAWKVHLGNLLEQELKRIDYQNEFWDCLLRMSGEFYLTISRYNQVGLSNLIKAVEDACQDIFYENDKQIKSYGSWKMIPISNDEIPKIVLEVERLK